jgi:hypothetical protein
MHDLIVSDDKCHVMAYSNDHSLLAVSLVKSLELYETTTWSLVHQEVERGGMVSALCWIPEASSSASNSLLLGVSGLDGTVSLCRVNGDITSFVLMEKFEPWTVGFGGN